MKNLAVYFSNVRKQNTSDWISLHKQLLPIFDNVYFIFDSRGDAESFLQFKVNVVIKNSKLCKIHKKAKSEFLLFCNKYQSIKNLTNHPFFKRHNGSIKWLIKYFFSSNRNFYLVKIFSEWGFILRKNQITHVMVMEPRNFLYTPSVIILEKLCQANSVDFGFIHASFVLNNVKIFNNLKRYECDLFEKYRKVELDKQKRNVIGKFIEDYRSFHREVLYKYLYKGNVPIYKYSKIYKRPYILWMTSKDNNYRSYYISPDWKMSDVVNRVAESIPDGFDLVVKSHPHGNKKILKILKRANIDTVKFIDNSYDSYDLIVNANAIITGASHSFSDALLYFKKLIILGSDNFVLSNENGPFLRINALNDLKYVAKYIESEQDIDKVLKLFFVIHDSIVDEYFSIAKFKDRFEKRKVFFNNKKANQIIIDYYQSICQ